jgi:DNA gyrase subunit B
MNEQEYNSGSIKILRGINAVRKRPGMYIGETNRKGLHHLIHEIVDNSVDEALAGYANQIDVLFHDDNSVSITDNGRGIPTGIHPEEGISSATLVFSELHSGGKFGDGGYKVSGGLHGVGACVTNALSDYLEVTIRQKGKVFFQRFEKGIPVNELSEIRDMKDDEINGTTVRFQPDKTMFPEAFEEDPDEGIELNPELILERMKRTTYLTKKLRINIVDKHGCLTSYYSENGLIDLIKDNSEELIEHEINEDDPLYLTEPFLFEGVGFESEVEIAFCYLNKFFKQNVNSFANNIFTEQGGTHVQGFEKAMTKVVNEYAANSMDINQVFIKEDVLEGINAAISFKTEEPKFSDQTKKKLSAGEGHKLTYAVLKEELGKFFEENPDTAKIIIQKTLNSKKVRENYESARKKIRREQSMNRLGGLPGKLADCQSRNLEDSEIFIVEGDSAGGSAKQARSRKTQAILPLKGKILNTLKSDNAKLESSEEVRNLITALKTDYDENYNHEKLRYGKVIIMTDADVDGAHIAVLLLTFFINKMPQLVQEGRVYLAMPPLYVLKKRTGKGEYNYIFDEEDFNEKYPNGTPEGYDKQRFKGLGEMNPEQLWETTMNPETRSLMRVVYKEEYKNDVYKVFEDLMGKDVEKRRSFIMEHALEANIDI